MPGGKGSGDVDFNTRDIIEMTPGINTGGLNLFARKSSAQRGGRLGNNFGFEIAGGATPERQAAVQGMSGALSNKASEFGLLRSEVRPGFGRLTQSRLTDLEDQRRRRVGDVRQALSRRRILGSNFARDEISREEAGFNRERDRITAESFLAELAASVDLVGKEFDSQAQSFQVLLDELNLEASTALALATGAQSVYGSLKGQAMQLSAEAQQQSAGGLNSLIGGVIGTGLGIGATYLTANPAIGSLIGSTASGAFGSTSGTTTGPFSRTSLGMVP